MVEAAAVTVELLSSLILWPFSLSYFYLLATVSTLYSFHVHLYSS